MFSLGERGMGGGLQEKTINKEATTGKKLERESSDSSLGKRRQKERIEDEQPRRK